MLDLYQDNAYIYFIITDQIQQAMTTFKTAYGWEKQENRKSIIGLRRLEMRITQVKCRKNCKCSVCGRIIEAGEYALKTVQFRGENHPKPYYFQNYCSECYSIVN